MNIKFCTSAHYPLPLQKNIKNLSMPHVWKIEYFEEITPVANQSDKQHTCSSHPCESQKIYPYGKVSGYDGSDNATPKMMYPGEKIRASVQKRGKKEQIVVHRNQTCSESVYCIMFVIWNHLVFEKNVAQRTPHQFKDRTAQSGLVFVFVAN